ncbi:MAG: hypothetical protein P9E88_13310 [Candidatus Competibacter sp.]|nr:hypothetical protein [Candidatus Competibacter sp.]
MCEESVVFKQREAAERKIKELHEYVRHIFQMFVGWFTFFATVNYATMGWLSNIIKEPNHSNKMIILICVLFITQNLLGIAVCFFLKKYLDEVNKSIENLEIKITNMISFSGKLSSMPVRLYLNSVYLVGIALVLISLGWCGIICIILLA